MMKGNIIKTLWGLFFLMTAFPSEALQERHLILVRQGGASALTEQGKEKIKQTGEILLTHGFDNRTIMAVYVAPDKGSLACAKLLATTGLFTENKIHKESRLSDKKTKNTVVSFYDEIEKKYKKGHVILIDNNTRSIELIEALTEDKPEKQSSQPYIVPLSLRTVV